MTGNKPDQSATGNDDQPVYAVFFGLRLLDGCFLILVTMKMETMMTPTKTAKPEGQTGWYVYVIRASDDSLYTGISTDVQRRFKEHGSPEKRAKYFRGRQPVAVVYSERHPDRSSALRREAAIKSLSRENKLKLIGTKTMKAEK